MDIVREDLSQKTYKSVKNRRWRKYPLDAELLRAIKNDSHLPDLLLELMLNRGVTPHELNNFLTPKLKDYMPDPFHLRDMEKAVKFLAHSISANKKIAIFGDYDVDGATSAALIKKYFTKLNIDTLVYIPDRIREGYGPNIEALKSLKEQDIDVVITVDCGAVAYDALNEAQKIGLEVVVIDHHIGGENLPEAVAVVNPNRFDESSQYGYLCAAGVSFLLLVGLNKELKNTSNKYVEPLQLLEMLDLVALGTVCDVVPIKGLNRAFVSQGLKLISKGSNIGMKALKQISNLKNDLDAYHLGFILGPRVNAGGRVGNANLGARLLSSDNFNEALEISRSLDMHNHERKAIEMTILEHSIKTVSQKGANKPIAFVVGNEWHLGVIGIIAGRIKEKFNKPAIVITVENGIGKASCRSVPGIDLGSVIHKAKKQNLLIAGGGHAMAAGFTVKEEDIDTLQEFIESEISEDYKKFLKEVFDHFDSTLTLSAIDINLVEDILKIGPFGNGNPHPKFYVKNTNIINSRIVGGEHISCLLTDGKVNTGKFIKAIAFRSLNSPIGEILLRNQKNVDIIAQLTLNKWNGQTSAEITICDIIIDTLS